MTDHRTLLRKTLQVASLAIAVGLGTYALPHAAFGQSLERQQELNQQIQQRSLERQQQLQQDINRSQQDLQNQELQRRLQDQQSSEQRRQQSLDPNRIPNQRDPNLPGSTR
jgi:hypothetical protein